VPSKYVREGDRAGITVPWDSTVLEKLETELVWKRYMTATRAVPP
jgi:hypothetical protein